MQAWNDNATGGWEWRKQGAYDLKPGRHTLTVANREDGAMLSQIRLTPRQSAEGLDETFAADGPADVLPAFNAAVPRTRHLDVYNVGRQPFAFTATASAPWIKLGAASGKVEDQTRLTIDVDWSKVPAGKATAGTVTIRGAGDEQVVRVEARPAPADAAAFVELDGYVSIEAEDFTRRRDGSGGAAWTVVGDLGRTGGAISVLPTTFASHDTAALVKTAPAVEYDLSLVSSPEQVEVTAYCLPTHRLNEGRGLRYAIAFDDETPQVVDFFESGGRGGEGSVRWRDNVSRNAAINVTTHKLAGAAGAGRHTLKVWAVDPGVVIDKLVVDAGGLRPSYLGPPPTRAQKAERQDSASIFAVSGCQGVRRD